MNLERLDVEIVKAREKAAHWTERLHDLEKQKTEQENLEILKAVRNLASSPEEIRALLNLLQESKPAQEMKPKEDPKHEE